MANAAKDQTLQLLLLSCFTLLRERSTSFGYVASRLPFSASISNLSPLWLILGLLVDEYYQVEMLDPSKMSLVQKQIWELIQKINLDEGM